MAKKTKSRLYKGLMVALSGAMSYCAAGAFLDYQYKNLPPSHVGKKIVEKMIGNIPQKGSEKDPHMITFEDDQRDRYEHRNSEEYGIEKPNDQYRIVVVGESTSWGAAVDREGTYAFRLQEKLRKEYSNQDILVLNGAMSGSVIRENLLRYILHEQKFDPDLVIIHVGVNDAASIVYGSEIKEKIDAKPRLGEKTLLSNRITGPITKYLWATWLKRSTQADKIGKKLIDLMNDPESLRKAFETANQYPERFHDDLETIVKFTKSNGSKIILFPIPVNPYEDFGDEKFDNAKKLVKVAIESNKRAIIDISKKEDTEYLEMNPEKIPEGAFVDSWHMNNTGHRLKAEALTRLIMEKQLIPKEMARRKAEQEREAINQAQQKTLEHSIDPNYSQPKGERNQTLQQIHDEYQANQLEAQNFQATATPQDKIETTSSVDSAIALQQKSKLEEVISSN